ncbi:MULTISPECIES: AAA family ATPase [Niastella]|uniref:AAA family ATPase n=1 Tax=Niastella soli TaxID=2821487 RepID=A0ABS3YX46_9BACT|nr:AAA family ATPase [Niastella soli]MBO9202504.1 AAA family ATPase [Niastella soli]
MTKNNPPVLFILSGLPASGKSTLSKFISREYQAAYLRIDTIEQTLRDLFRQDVYGEGYGVAYKVAADNLKLGQNVVADSCNPIILTRNEWENVAKRNGCLSVNIEVICSDKEEHKDRLKNRQLEVENLQPLTWENVENREFHDWNGQRITIDTANKTIEETVIELLNEIKNLLDKKE